MSLRSRVLLAVLLTVTFYGLALLIVGALIGGPFIVLAATGRFYIWAAIVSIGAGLAILGELVPRRAQFQSPGPAIKQREQPELHALVADVAKRVGGREPDIVFVVLEANAWVLEHRGVRIMALGLPLLATMDEDELRALVAHELGHYEGGDTRLSGWIWHARSALMRTNQNLATSDKWFRRYVVRYPFVWYMLLFLRVTNAVSRREEYAADATAAQATSPEAASRMLRRVAILDPAFDGYWRRDVVPMLDTGRRPQIAEGFSTMVHRSRLTASLDEFVAERMAEGDPDPYASHPTLRQRLRALGVPEDERLPAAPERAALSLLRDAPELELRLLSFHFGNRFTRMSLGSWSQDAGASHVKLWRPLADKYATVYADPDATLAEAGSMAADLDRYREVLRARLDPDEQEVPDEDLDRLAIEVLAALVAIALSENGASVTASPGDPVEIRVGEELIDPWGELERIAAGESSAESWRTRVGDLGLADAKLDRLSTHRAVAR
jgi:Zn-dependent protease with chaperone function